jgi:hypothetical protein
MSRWLRRWNWGGSQIAPDLPCAMADDSTDQCPFRAVRVVPTAGPPLLIHRYQRTYSETARAGKRARSNLDIDRSIPPIEKPIGSVEGTASGEQRFVPANTGRSPCAQLSWFSSFC